MAGQPETAAGRRWYRHGLNRPLSWELVLRITPRLPRFLLVPLHHVTTFVCMLCMPSERAAARRNLQRVTGRGFGWTGHQRGPTGLRRAGRSGAVRSRRACRPRPRGS